MDRNSELSPVQLVLLMVGSALVFPYTFMPILTTPPANQDAWLVLSISPLYILIISAPVLFLLNKFKGRTVMEIFEVLMGKYLGKAAGLILTAFCAFCFGACMLITSVFINTYVLDQTPTWAILIYMIVPISYAAAKDAVTMGRIAMFIVPFMILTIIVFLLLGIDQMDFSVLRPVLADSTFIELNQGAFLTAARYSEILILLVFSSFLPPQSSIPKIFSAGLGLFGICFFLILIPTMTVLGVELGQQALNPYFVFTRQVEAYDFITRVQSFNILAWFPVVLLKLTIYNFMGSYVLAGIFKSNSHKGFVVPLSIIGFIICLLPALNKSSTVELLRSDSVFPFIVLPFTFILPLIMVLIALLKKRSIAR